MFSQRTEISYELNELTRRRRWLESRGRRLLDLTSSNPTELTYAGDRTWLSELSGQGALSYLPDPLGWSSSRQLVCAAVERSGVALEPEQMVLTASTSEAYGYLFKLLADSGDEVMVPRPSYPLFEHLARLDGLSSVPYELGYDGSFYLDLDSIQQRITPRTKAIVLVHPNNPTGTYLTKPEIDALGLLGIPLIVDEVFFEYPWFPTAPLAPSPLALSHLPVFGLGGLSKLVGLPQLKLGWILVRGRDRFVADAMERLVLIADTYLSVGAPVQLALRAILEQGSSRRATLLDRVRNNLGQLDRLIYKSPVTRLVGQAGWTAVLRVPDVQSEQDYALTLLEQDGILVQPGHFYDFTWGCHLVVSLLAPPEVFDRGITQLVSRVTSIADVAPIRG